MPWWAEGCGNGKSRATAQAGTASGTGSEAETETKTACSSGSKHELDGNASRRGEVVVQGDSDILGDSNWVGHITTKQLYMKDPPTASIRHDKTNRGFY